MYNTGHLPQLKSIKEKQESIPIEEYLFLAALKIDISGSAKLMRVFSNLCYWLILNFILHFFV